MNGSGTRMNGSGTRTNGSGTRMNGSGTRMNESGTRTNGSGTRTNGSGTRMNGSGTRMNGSGTRMNGSGTHSDLRIATKRSQSSRCALISESKDGKVGKRSAAVSWPREPSQSMSARGWQICYVEEETIGSSRIMSDFPKDRPLFHGASALAGVSGEVPRRAVATVSGTGSRLQRTTYPAAVRKRLCGDGSAGLLHMSAQFLARAIQPCRTRATVHTRRTPSACIHWQNAFPWPGDRAGGKLLECR
jgi:hypothetical protein